ncbi:Phosphate regulon transcriptional regulatory protein PhoB (SphR) [Minicystis rosea]|nr:Phosphate regulon transcriptional regulatory protein PhoB (SphR) [Minicystis rosea]
MLRDRRRMTEDAKKPLGRILLRQRAVTQPELDKALESAIPGGPPLATRMIESGTLSELAALKALSEQSGVPGIDLNQVCLRLRDLDIVPREVAMRHKLLPVLVREDRVFVAMASPTDKKVIDEIGFVTGKHVFPYVALAGPLMRVITAAYQMRERGEQFYVGPTCPPEIQRKAGLVPTEPPEAALPDHEGIRAAQIPPAPTRTPAAPPVDDSLRRPSFTPNPPPVPNRRPPPLPNRAGLQRPSITPEPQRVSDPDAGFRPATGRSEVPTTTAVVVDDAMGRMAGADELNEADFGSVNRDLSVMAELPAREEASGGRPHLPGRPTILVVDDEPEIRRLVRRVLEERQYNVLEAARGHTALGLLKEHPPDLCILDAMLPEVHGFDIAKRMKGTERYGHIPIIMISAVYRGWRFAEDLKASYGVDAYLEKPFKMADLVRAVETALSQKGPSSSAEQISAEAEKKLAAGIEAYQKGDLAGAIEHLKEGTRIDPLAFRLHFHLGLLYGKQGRIYDAIQELQTALDINGRHFPALKNLAVLYQKVGFRNKAIETWERALRVAPDDPTRQSIKEHLVGLL